MQGGNTFWLYHCIEKGDWKEDLIKACSGPDAAVYCGTSAGAIVMGETMETACWKVGTVDVSPKFEVASFWTSMSIRTHIFDPFISSLQQRVGMTHP